VVDFSPLGARRWRVAAALGALLLLLGGCAAPTPERVSEREQQESYERRARILGDWSRWGLNARLGIELEGDGGSGRFDWSVREQESELNFRGTLGQGAWRLQIDPAGATLSRADGSVARAASVDLLLRREIGWPVPVDSLRWWVRGLAAPGADGETRLQLDDSGLPVTISEGDWQVTFTRWSDFEGQRLPRRLEASNGEVSVRLAISRWWHEPEASVYHQASTAAGDV
jgi:outer membrane lipoprotein LolB